MLLGGRASLPMVELPCHQRLVGLEKTEQRHLLSIQIPLEQQIRGLDCSVRPCSSILSTLQGFRQCFFHVKSPSLSSPFNKIWQDRTQDILHAKHVPSHAPPLSCFNASWLLYEEHCSHFLCSFSMCSFLTIPQTLDCVCPINKVAKVSFIFLGDL